MTSAVPPPPRGTAFPADTIGTYSGTATGIEADVDTCVGGLVKDIPPATTTITTTPISLDSITLI